MKYLYCLKNEHGAIHRNIINTEALSLAEIAAGLKARKMKGRVEFVKFFELDFIILKAIKERNIGLIHESITHACEGRFTLEELEAIANKCEIEYQQAEISKDCDHDAEMWLIVNDYIITFSGKYNTHGLLELSNITVYDQTDSIIMQKDY